MEEHILKRNEEARAKIVKFFDRPTQQDVADAVQLAKTEISAFKNGTINFGHKRLSRIEKYIAENF